MTGLPPRCDDALAAAARGFRVIPVDGKRPILRDWPRRATSDAAVIRDMWARRPQANVGIATGCRPDPAVIDVDPRHGGFDSLEQLAAEHGEWPGGLRVETGGGGRHLYYEAPTGSNLRSRTLAPGVELKAQGSQVVAPASIHPSTGKPYRWVDADAPVPSLPEWIWEPSTSAPVARSGDGWPSLLAADDSDGPDSLLAHLAETGFRQPIVWTGEVLRACDSFDPFVAAACELTGIPEVGVGVPFLCVLPGHEEDEPSASLWRDDSGAVVYHDWHGDPDDQFWLLAEVYEACQTGECRIRNTPEISRWKLRLLVETGFLEPADVPAARLPDRVSAVIRRVYDGFVYLLRCRWVNEPGEPTPYTWRFAARWCGVTIGQAGRAIGQLVDARYMLEAGHMPGVGCHQGTPLYLPGYPI